MRQLAQLRRGLAAAEDALAEVQAARKRAETAFDDMDNLKDEQLTAVLKAAVRALIDAAERMA